MNSIVYNTDCMQGMKQYPDKYFDLAVVDPPYGINISLELHNRGKSCKKNGYRQYSLKDWDNCIPNEDYFKELDRISKNRIIWGGNYFLEYLASTRCFIVWDKGQRGFSFADAELAWTSFDKSVRCFDYSRGKMQSESYGKFHPTAKPVALYDWIYKNYLPNGGRVIDTHLGSGSNRIAAHKAGNIDFTGFELDEDYYKAQEKRYKNFIAQLRMF